MPAGGRASLADAQAAAAVGQIALAGAVGRAARPPHGIVAAQLLLTLDDLEDRRRYLNAAATLARLLEAGAVPVVNENDSVATAEIRFGDNDRLAARVAQAAAASAVVLLSDVDGLFDRDPRDPAAELVREVAGRGRSGARDGQRRFGLGPGLGRNGLQARRRPRSPNARGSRWRSSTARTLHRSRTRCRPSVGTLFRPRDGATAARKAWLGGRLAPSGRADGRSRAARRRWPAGSSLLAAGVTAGRRRRSRAATW